MDENFNKLTPAETERLALLAEECGEVVQIIGKILRHGYESTNPVTGDGITNRYKLERELGDIMFGIYLGVNNKDVSLERILNYVDNKRKTILQWLHHTKVDVDG